MGVWPCNHDGTMVTDTDEFFKDDPEELVSLGGASNYGLYAAIMNKCTYQYDVVQLTNRLLYKKY